ncbi:hypothetical protein [Ghiorsea bivora]|uniref:hypothetical protein n=1 Tax=Ghiorsea bivora TaxID=1485545 RepID=UPI0005705AED|nr:hypothetical protein [Ghiorsea bivora]
MPQEIIKDIHFKGQKSKVMNPAKMWINTYNEKEQKVRAIKTLLNFWGIAALCILIPIAHFLLVPLFFIMGIMKSMKLLHKAEDGLYAEGNCPACEKQIKLNLDNNADLPQWIDCPNCKQAIELNQ